MLAFLAPMQTGSRSERLNQRVTPETKALIDRASALQGVSPTDFTVAHVTQAARETISRLEVTVLRPEDRVAFMRAFEDTEPNKELVDLLALHSRVTSKR
jgi:uncharacterized protein (DUF1778 family)